MKLAFILANLPFTWISRILKNFSSWKWILFDDVDLRVTTFLFTLSTNFLLNFLLNTHKYLRSMILFSLRRFHLYPFLCALYLPREYFIAFVDQFLFLSNEKLQAGNEKMEKARVKVAGNIKRTAKINQRNTLIREANKSI